MPNNASHFHPSGVMSIILGNNIACDHKATSKSHRQVFANCDMLDCVPAVKLMPDNNTANTAIPMIASVAIPLSS